MTFAKKIYSFYVSNYIKMPNMYSLKLYVQLDRISETPLIHHMQHNHLVEAKKLWI